MGGQRSWGVTMAVAAAWWLGSIADVRAQRPETKELARLKAENARLRQELEERERHVKQVQQEVARLRQELAEREQTLARLRKQQAADKTEDKRQEDEMKKLRGIVQAPYVHVVLFYLKSDAPNNHADTLVQDCQQLLGKIPSVRHVWAGPPAKQATPEVAQQDFQVGLVVLFDNYDDLKKYLDHPLHNKFVAKHNRYLQRVIVHDFRVPRP
ncbi:hypothetical protein HRbin36_00466 [bacterium HR36]|nr:hypothetical protein HRbin36_00466 [bacterium HR36]